MYTFDSLPEMWAASVDALSGRDSPILQPAQKTTNWPWYTEDWAVAARIGRWITATIRLPDNSPFEMRCPVTADNAKGYSEVLGDAKWRKALVWSAGPSYGKTVWDGIALGLGLRLKLLATWTDTPPPNYTAWPQPNMVYFMPELTGVASLSVLVYILERGGWTWHKHCIGRPDGPTLRYRMDHLQVDLVPFVWGVNADGYPMTPQNPQNQEWLANICAFAGIGTISCETPEEQGLQSLTNALCHRIRAVTHADTIYCEAGSEIDIQDAPQAGRLAALARAIRSKRGYRYGNRCDLESAACR